MKTSNLMLMALICLFTTQYINCFIVQYPTKARVYGQRNHPDYDSANSIWKVQPIPTSQDKCRKIQYLSFRIGLDYLTAGPHGLTFQFAFEPKRNQLFIGEQQNDGTWGFRSLTQNKYIRADQNGVTINWQVGAYNWQRWWMERNGNTVMIQNAYFRNRYWINQKGVLRQLSGGAQGFNVEYIPTKDWLWNW